MTTVTQFQKPGARDANNSNPVSNYANGNEILCKNIFEFYINGERSSAGFSTTVSSEVYQKLASVLRTSSQTHSRQHKKYIMSNMTQSLYHSSASSSAIGQI
jgi:hypothetical protein